MSILLEFWFAAEGVSFDSRQTAAFLDSEFDMWARVVKQRNIKAD